MSRSRALQWAHIVPGLDPRLGGIAASAPALCHALRVAAGHRASLISVSSIEEGPSSDLEEIETYRVRSGRLSGYLNKDWRRGLEGIISVADVVHIHGIWTEHCAAACRLARRHRKCYVVSAHGMLEPWALHQKRWKKLVYSALVERRNLRRAACLRALTRGEVIDYRRYGLTTPCVVIPNGVEVPDDQLSPELFLNKFPTLRGTPIVLFLGRLHPKKGLEVLCRAWASIIRRIPEARLLIAGPDCGGTESMLRSLVAELNLAPTVTFAGMLNGPLKWSALSAASVFVLPSHSEGFSIAVLEALAAGCPVVISKNCNFPEVTGSCGLVIEPNTSSVAQALGEVLSAPSFQKCRMADAGRNLVRSRYAWPIIGAQMAEVGEWLIGGSLPTSVEVFT